MTKIPFGSSDARYFQNHQPCAHVRIDLLNKFTPKIEDISLDFAPKISRIHPRI